MEEHYQLLLIYTRCKEQHRALQLGEPLCGSCLSIPSAVPTVINRWTKPIDDVHRQMRRLQTQIDTWETLELVPADELLLALDWIEAAFGENK